jgi:uncharacterized protein YndB with AHSA1/START domain/biotin operon repressor
VERVFKAMADPTRRELLDELFRRDGQSLNALAGRFAMTRVAVAKHLRLLEEAGLVVPERRGREKLHFLNPVPIRLLHDRWVSKYTETWAAGLVDLKRHLEADVEKVFEIFIRTTPQRLWQAITDPRTRARFQFGAHVESDWTAGSAYRVGHEGAGGLIEGENLEVEPPWRLVQTFHAIWDDDIAAQGTSQVTWQIEQVGDSCRLVVLHGRLAADADEHLYGGWPMVLSGLKTWLETGTELTTPGSLRYGGEPS